MSLLKRVFVLLVLTPSPPQNLTVVLHGTNTITIGWQAPSQLHRRGNPVIPTEDSKNLVLSTGTL